MLDGQQGKMAPWEWARPGGTAYAGATALGRLGAGRLRDAVEMSCGPSGGTSRLSLEIRGRHSTKRNFKPVEDEKSFRKET